MFDNRIAFFDFKKACLMQAVESGIYSQRKVILKIKKLQSFENQGVLITQIIKITLITVKFILLLLILPGFWVGQHRNRAKRLCGKPTVVKV